MEILSIQSSVAYGHVGNSAAVFPLQRLGIEAWAVNTVHFSNHTGYGEWRGPLLSTADLREVIRGVEERGVLGRLSAVLSGYQGGEEVGAVVLETVARTKEREPGRGVLLRPGDGRRRARDVRPPGHPGADARPGRPGGRRDHPQPLRARLPRRPGDAHARPSVLAAVDDVRGRGPATVLVTSVLTEETPEGSVDLVAVSPEGAWRTRTPLLPISPNGGGDVTAAVFLAHLLTLRLRRPPPWRR